ncbi:hypothetical protein [Flavobacterium yafengii]|uniref:Uncharacterized protein n=1 Tax=Flavobacterium yafengii TaxID=3041253 RepID=A0AAW6TS84_9FLAO|nr:hypothetical protein [Flavobacterium yafengii]MDI5950338.1 hypothetical protein [Flavobacterium yafengii]
MGFVLQQIPCVITGVPPLFLISTPLTAEILVIPVTGIAEMMGRQLISFHTIPS